MTVSEEFTSVTGGFRGELLAHCYRMLGSAEEAEDLVQETYLRAVKAFGQLTPNSNLKGWLFVIMRNAWLNQIRHVKSGPRFVDLAKQDNDVGDWVDEQVEDPYAIYLRKLEGKEIAAAIQTLPSLYREIVVLRDIEGFTYNEIASLLGCPAGTVMSRLGRARERLRRSLGGHQKAAAKAG